MKIASLSSVILFSLLLTFGLSNKDKTNQKILSHLKNFNRICSNVIELSFAKDFYKIIDSYYDAFKQNASCFHQSKDKLRDLKHILEDGMIMCHLFKEYPQTTTVQEAFFSPIWTKLVDMNNTFLNCSKELHKDEGNTDSDELSDFFLNDENLLSVLELAYKENAIDSLEDESLLDNSDKSPLRTLKRRSIFTKKSRGKSGKHKKNVEPPKKPKESPKKPKETPKKPAETPTQPTEPSQQPTENPIHPAETPAKPTENPAPPADTPAPPSENPAPPADTPAPPS